MKHLYVFIWKTQVLSKLLAFGCAALYISTYIRPTATGFKAKGLAMLACLMRVWGFEGLIFFQIGLLLHIFNLEI